jgi:uncharacterized protein (DUF433 family)
MPVVALDYIEVDDRGIASVIGSRVKVMHLIASQRANGWSAEQLCAEYPHLQPAQVYAALAYYHANKSEVDRQIDESVRFAEEMRGKHPNKLTREEWVARWKTRFPDRPVPGEESEAEGAS